MSDRLTRQQLKQDPLMRRTADAADFVNEHSRTVLIGVLTVVVVAAVVLFVRSGSQRAQEQAAGMLTEAWGDYSRGALDPAAARLEEIVRGMGGTAAGKQALLLYGDVRFAQGRYTEAEGYYQRALAAFSDDQVLGASARRGLAASLENQDRHLDAAEVYQHLADNAPNNTLRFDLLMDVARNLLQAGQQTRALTLYEEIAKNPDNTEAAEQAKIRLAEARLITG